MRRWRGGKSRGGGRVENTGDQTGDRGLCNALEMDCASRGEVPVHGLMWNEALLDKLARGLTSSLS